jgi:predicted AlkP superfamily pyrophosphatase or phosphodiesterase
MRHFLAAFVLLALAGCATPTRSSAPRGDITILISIDGFRADYLDRGATPMLARLAREGVRGSMRPSFPSLTFPNHYAMVTGRTPDHNGIVANAMEDASRPGEVFTMGNTAVASNPLWWADAEPLWITAEKQGVATATMFWPGSDYEIHARRPRQWRAFDQTLTGFGRVDQLLAWLDASPQPRFATLYFDLVDTAGHRYGPDAGETMSAAAEVDAAIARLVEGLGAKGLADRANLVVVADHGMAAYAKDGVIDLNASLSTETAKVIYAGATALISPLPGKAADVERALVGRSAHGECWRKADLPKRFGYGTHRRVAAIICLADMGWRYRWTRPGQGEGGSIEGGGHGYDPDAAEMTAVFLACGPAFRAGVRVPKFPNVSIYPLLAKLVGVTPEANDGSLSDTAAALR